VAVFPQPSVATYVRVCDREHPSGITAPNDEVISGVPQSSVAVATPGAGTVSGLHPRSKPKGQNVNTGGVTSTVQVNTCVHVAVLPQPSVAVYVLVCVLKHPSGITAPNDEVIPGVPQSSVAMAAPGAGKPLGLQPSSEPGGQNVNTGGITSTVQVNTCVQVAVFPHPSVAVYVLVCDLKHPSGITEPRDDVIPGVPQSSVAVATPGAGTLSGLHPRSEPTGQNVNTGGVTSTVQVNTCVQVAVFPHPSVAV